ncbi:MAG: AAA family ATPase [Candidatus Sumerlaeota bacterium]|nr:AAA family ATPase [Candidatus Sumerlaeota bacterium]
MKDSSKQGPTIDRLKVATRLIEIPIETPREMEERLVRLGYRGQKQARQAVCVFAYRHLQRLRRVFLQEIARESLPPREHLLLAGPSGCGKTYLAESLFRNMLGLPCAVVDITQFSEVGYHGEDVVTLLSRLYEAAGDDLDWASTGLIILDEFDKLASRSLPGRFAGGPSKDVSGAGVQRELLTLLSGRAAEFPVRAPGRPGWGPRLTMPLDNLAFVACGAFSGLSCAAPTDKPIGFHANKIEGSAFRASYSDQVDTQAFVRFGLMPELMGRMRVVPFEPLPADVMRSILEDNALPRYVAEFSCEGIGLVVENCVKDAIIRRALKDQV